MKSWILSLCDYGSYTGSYLLTYSGEKRLSLGNALLQAASFSYSCYGITSAQQKVRHSLLPSGSSSSSAWAWFARA
jgi:hypothetical protein